MKVNIVINASGNGYSVEAGLADGQFHFDHHRNHADQPAPCVDRRIPILGIDDVVEITHIDADTLCGLLRMAGRALPEVDLFLMERIDLNGSSIVEDRFDPTLLYMVGVGEVVRGMKFPRVSAENPVIDVTELIFDMFERIDFDIIEIGREATKRSEAANIDCRKAISESGRVGLWVIGATDALDPSRPYADRVEVVVVFRRHYESISIYCPPLSSFGFEGKTVAGIEFAGHPKACGSPRGVAMTEEDAVRVFEEIASQVG